MKKIMMILLILSMLFFKEVRALDESDYVIKYKWYKEEIVDEMYYKKGEMVEGYLEDENKIKYGIESASLVSYCSYPKESYVISMDVDMVYKKVSDIRYVKIIGLDKDADVLVFENTDLIEYSYIDKNDDGVILDLKRNYEVGNLWFYVDTLSSLKMYLYADKRLVNVSLYNEEIIDKNIIIPDKEWIHDDTKYSTLYTQERKKENEFLTYLSQRGRCRVKEILTYRYKTRRIYYDDEYHEEVLGYLPDYDDYIIEYNKDIPTHTIEITNTIREFYPVYRYNSLLDSSDIDSSLDGTQEKIIDEEVTYKEDREVEIRYVSEKNEILYILIVILILLVVFEFFLIIKRRKLEKMH